MKLNLTKPIVFLDLETTGVDPAKDRIVEISLAKIMPDGTREVKTRRLNPEMHIPEAASAIHGIYDKDVADCPTFREVSKSLWSYIEGCDFGAITPISSISRCWSRSFSARAWISIWTKAVLSTYRISSIAWSSVRSWLPTSSIAVRTHRGAFGRSRYAGYL